MKTVFQTPLALANFLRCLSAPGLALLLSACASSPTAPPADALAASPWARACRLDVAADASPGTPWQHFKLPGKQPNHYTPVQLDGRDAILAESNASASMLRYKLHVAPQDLRRLTFSWKVPHLIPGADMTLRDFADSPVRLVLAFDGDRSRFSARNQMLSELARVVTGEEMPYATLMYVWANDAPVGSVIPNVRTDRIQKIVMASGPDKLNQWLSFDRSIREDFEKAFGEPPGPLIGIGIMTDTDNTRAQARAWYGPIRLSH